MKSAAMGLACLFFLACGPAQNDIAGQNNVMPLAAPAPGKGIQLRMTKTAMPGEESYGCRLFQVPAGGLFVHEETVQYGIGGHHVLLYRTPYHSIPVMDERGASVDAGEIHDCEEGATSRWKIDAVVGGSEIFGSHGMLRGLPEGVAVYLPENTVLVMSVHYLNASAQPTIVDARMNLQTIAPHEVKEEAGLLYLDNHVLYVPAMGSSVTKMRCPVPSNVSIVNLQSHMHGRGKMFDAFVSNSSADQPLNIYETEKWLEPPIKTFEPFLRLSKGQSIEIQCEYSSSETRNIGHGPESTDEMCQLIGPYFPRDERLERCQNEHGDDSAVWTGQGSADGQTTRTCLECAPEIGGAEYAACVLGSCPKLANEVSAVVRCQLGQDRECETELETLSKAGCW